MWAWIFGFGAVISLFISHQSKKRSGILAGKLCADICWAAHYFILGAAAGMIPNFVGIFRELVFINRAKNKFFGSILWPIIFILTNFTLGVLSFDGWFDILPLTASALVTVSLWVNNPRLTKIISIPVCTAFLIYNISVPSYLGVFNESVSLISILIFFIKARSENEKTNLHK